MEVDNLKHKVRLDGRPNLGGKESRWTIRTRPTIVIIDPLGPRRNDTLPAPNNILQGMKATLNRSDKAHNQVTLKLDGAQPLDRINPQSPPDAIPDQGQWPFDTIYLPDDDADTAQPLHTYRIVSVDPPNRLVTIAGQPSVPTVGSRWQIPAGVSGAPPALAYDVSPPQNPGARRYRGFDHYDGVLYVVHRGIVKEQFRWTSYTSRDYGTWTGDPSWPQYLSSIRGNSLYFYSSFRAATAAHGGNFRNYSFAIVDATPTTAGLTHDQNDHIALARYYFGRPTIAQPAGGDDALQANVSYDDTPAAQSGKTLVRLHSGLPVPDVAVNPPNPNPHCSSSGSAGCVVSPHYYDMRTLLVKLYEDDYEEFFGPGPNDPGALADPEVQPLVTSFDGLDPMQYHTMSKGLFENNAVTETQWDAKLVGKVWLIRPDELPIG